MTFRRLDEFTRFPQFRVTGEQRTFVYGLVDPRDNTIRYIGVSINPKMRLRYHLSKQSNWHLQEWFQELRRRNAGKPGVVTLAEVCENTWDEAEKSWIGFFRGAGELYNVHDGGTQKGGGGKPKFNGLPSKGKRRGRRRKHRHRMRHLFLDQPETVPVEAVDEWLEAMARDSSS